jgi:outer membrane receptor protein involved in Fe transport
MAVAFGAEYRSEAIKLEPDDPARFGDATGAGGVTSPQPLASFSVREVFVEARLPLVEDAPFAKLLQINGAYRYSSYSSAGSTNTYSYGAEWQPIEDFRLRGSYQRAVRAPNVLELFTPQSVQLTDGTFNDPCYSNPAAFANCNAATGGASLMGTPAGSPLLSCPASQCNQLIGGNPLLSPETADTRSAGIVLTPTFFPGFSATIDYWNIKLSNIISSFGAQSILDECYVQGNASFCDLISRNSIGQIIGAGFVINLNTNVPGTFKTSGWDFEVNYTTDLADWGMNGAGGLAVNFIGTWLEELGGAEGTYNHPSILNPAPEWRHKLRVTWSSPFDVDISGQWRHFSSVDLFDAPSVQPLEEIDYIDLALVWHAWEGVELRGGVNNVFDVRPPLTSFAGTAPGNGNTFPGVYDALGRFVFIGGTVKM